MSFTDWVPTTSPSIPPDATSIRWVESVLGREVGEVEALVRGVSTLSANSLNSMGFPTFVAGMIRAMPVPTWTAQPELWRAAKRLAIGDLPAHPVSFQQRNGCCQNRLVVAHSYQLTGIS